MYMVNILVTSVCVPCCVVARGVLSALALAFAVLPSFGSLAATAAAAADVRCR